MHKGSCCCGSVSYEVRGAFAYAGYCHCEQCRKSSGSAFNAFAGARAEHFVLTAGAEAVREFAKGKDSLLGFCSNCGSNLFVRRPSLGFVHVRLGTLDDDPGLRPMAHVFVAEKAPWHAITDALPQFEREVPRPPVAAAG